MISTTLIVALLLHVAEGVHQCPMYGIGGLGYPYSGTYCGSESIFHYYTCCEHNFYECCFNLEPWVMYVNSDLYPYGPLTSADYLSQWMAPCTTSPCNQQSTGLVPSDSYTDNCGNVNCDANCNNDCCCCDDGIDYCNMDAGGYGVMGSSYLPNSPGLLMYPHYNQPFSTLNNYGIPYSPHLYGMFPYAGYPQILPPFSSYAGLRYPHMQRNLFSPVVPPARPPPNPIPISPVQPPVSPPVPSPVLSQNQQYFSPQYYDLYRQYIQAIHGQQVRHLKKIERCKRKCKGKPVHGADLQTQMDPNDESTSKCIIYFSVALVILLVVGILVCLGCCGFCIWTVRPSD
ncbi:unnamed protein product [Bursaphelenchus xylophilus]|uniref:(pine wood nematode) hypothetical protein n=1 Tax=Bursaphelenchus xylophilus TaxID=6326 RepID=A0A1I7RZV2_BURXY|nr:unnamed protein product [Bursaphelenchus xylophilus]CAG9109208.1 unnamed protein product [Bursaphelenchus xylophilus]